MSKANAHVTAFVMAGGGSLGAVEVGMLRELLAWGEMPSPEKRSGIADAARVSPILATDMKG
jgi:hypothetical protein